MDRRSFLGAAALAALAAGFAGAAERRRPPVPDFICGEAPRGGIRPVAMDAPAGGLVIAGTRLFKEGFFNELLDIYNRVPGRDARMLGGGCDDGVTGVRLGTAHLGCLCCPVAGSPAEGMNSLRVAWDMKVVVAHPAVRADGISTRQLRDVVTGRTRNWKALGGPDRPIALVVSDHCPDYVEPVRRDLMANRQDWSAQALVVKTDQKQLETTARFENAIGVNSWIIAEPFVRKGQLKVLDVDGVAPTLANVAAGRYRLAGPMNVIYREWSPESMAPFFDLLYGEVGREILSRHVVPVEAGKAGYPPRRRA
jgi:phosphate transport system substrate-binding protein